jgi:hypothetical protein
MAPATSGTLTSARPVCTTRGRTAVAGPRGAYVGGRTTAAGYGGGVYRGGYGYGAGYRYSPSYYGGGAVGGYRYGYVR